LPGYVEALRAEIMRLTGDVLMIRLEAAKELAPAEPQAEEVA
jgi:hypothetical protein